MEHSCSNFTRYGSNHCSAYTTIAAMTTICAIFILIPDEAWVDCRSGIIGVVPRTHDAFRFVAPFDLPALLLSLLPAHHAADEVGAGLDGQGGAGLIHLGALERITLNLGINLIGLKKGLKKWPKWVLERKICMTW